MAKMKPATDFGWNATISKMAGAAPALPETPADALLKVTCKQCGKEFNVPANFSGTIPCPYRCGAEVTLGKALDLGEGKEPA